MPDKVIYVLNFDEDQFLAVLGAIEQMEAEFGFDVWSCKGCKEWTGDFPTTHTPECYSQARDRGQALLADLRDRKERWIDNR
jgi:hypothetical protein